MNDEVTLEIRVSGDRAGLLQALQDCLKESRFEALEPHRDIGTVIEVIKVVGAVAALTRELIQLANTLKARGGEKPIKAEVINEDGKRLDLLNAQESAVAKLL